MFGPELRRPVDLVLGAPPEPEIVGGQEMDYFRRLKEQLQVAHDYPLQALASAGVRQKRAYDIRCRGRAFVPRDKVWVYSPVRKKGVSPKLCSHLQGPAEFLARISEVLYPICMPGQGHTVVLYKDRISPYGPLATPVVRGGDATGITCSDQDDSLPTGLNQPTRLKKALGHLNDFVWGDGVVPHLTPSGGGLCSTLEGGAADTRTYGTVYLFVDVFYTEPRKGHGRQKNEDELWQDFAKLLRDLVKVTRDLTKLLGTLKTSP